MMKRNAWSDGIDRVIEWMKWPTATIALLSFPLFMWALLRLLVHIITQPLGIVPLAMGCVGFMLVWRRWLDRTAVGRWLITFEHEMTHAIFAWITWHHVVRLRASLGRGGEVRFIGKGNWLITIAPYFFPTAALFLLVLAYLMPVSILPWRGFFLGIALGFHLVSTYRETHRDQTDLKQVGSTFCWMFLPTANLAVLGLIVAWAHGGSDNVEVWWKNVHEPLSAIQSIWTEAETVEPVVPSNSEMPTNVWPRSS